VSVDGERIWSKLETGAFPVFDDLLAEVASRAA
jgi:hypothetical protein